MAYHQPWSLSEVESFTGALSHITMRLIYWPCPECNSILSHIFFSLYFQGLQEDTCQRWHLRDRFTEEEDKCQISFGAHMFSSVQSLSCVPLFVTPWTAAHQASLIITNSWSLHKFMSIELVMPSNHLIFCHPLVLPPLIFPSIRVFSTESALRIRWPKYWSFSFNISPSSEHPGLISFRMDWLVNAS